MAVTSAAPPTAVAEAAETQRGRSVSRNQHVDSSHGDRHSVRALEPGSRTCPAALQNLQRSSHLHTRHLGACRTAERGIESLAQRLALAVSVHNGFRTVGDPVLVKDLIAKHTRGSGWLTVSAPHTVSFAAVPQDVCCVVLLELLLLPSDGSSGVTHGVDCSNATHLGWVAVAPFASLSPHEAVLSTVAQGGALATGHGLGPSGAPVLSCGELFAAACLQHGLAPELGRSLRQIAGLLAPDGRHAPLTIRVELTAGAAVNGADAYAEKITRDDDSAALRAADALQVRALDVPAHKLPAVAVSKHNALPVCVRPPMPRRRLQNEPELIVTPPHTEPPPEPAYPAPPPDTTPPQAEVQDPRVAQVLGQQQALQQQHDVLLAQLAAMQTHLSDQLETLPRQIAALTAAASTPPNVSPQRSPAQPVGMAAAPLLSAGEANDGHHVSSSDDAGVPASHTHTRVPALSRGQMASLLEAAAISPATSALSAALKEPVPELEASDTRTVNTVVLEFLAFVPTEGAEMCITQGLFLRFRFFDFQPSQTPLYSLQAVRTDRDSKVLVRCLASYLATWHCEMCRCRCWRGLVASCMVCTSCWSCFVQGTCCDSGVFITMWVMHCLRLLQVKSRRQTFSLQPASEASKSLKFVVDGTELVRALEQLDTRGTLSALDPQHLVEQRHLDFVKYTMTRQLCVDVFAGASRLHVGTASLDLRGLLRQGREHCEHIAIAHVRDVRVPCSPPGSLGSGSGASAGPALSLGQLQVWARPICRYGRADLPAIIAQGCLQQSSLVCTGPSHQRWLRSKRLW